jgi:hypothetical protein
VFHTDLHLFARVAIGCVVAFVFGFERQLRGSPAGDGTFILIRGAATAVTAVAGLASPQAVAGILTGLGFFGAGLVFTAGNKVRGLTSAASVFAVAGIGIVIGFKPHLPRSLPGRPVACSSSRSSTYPASASSMPARTPTASPTTGTRQLRPGPRAPNDPRLPWPETSRTPEPTTNA